MGIKIYKAGKELLHSKATKEKKACKKYGKNAKKAKSEKEEQDIIESSTIKRIDGELIN